MTAKGVKGGGSVLYCIVLYCIVPPTLELLQPGGVHSQHLPHLRGPDQSPESASSLCLQSPGEGAGMLSMRRVHRRSPSALRFNNSGGGGRGGSRREREKEKQERLNTTRRRKTSAAKVMTHF